MEKRSLNILVIVVSILIIFVTWNLFINRPLIVKLVDVNFEVSDKAGVDLTDGELSFGRLRIGDSVVRNVIIENNYDFKIHVDIFVSSELADFLFSESEYYFEVGEEIYIPFNLVIHEGAEFGQYEGEVRFEVFEV